MKLYEFFRLMKPIDTDNYEQFLEELFKVPDVNRQFQELLDKDPKWEELAQKTKDSEGFHVFFQLEKLPAKLSKKENRPNELLLRKYSFETEPALKVQVYI